MLTIMNGIGNYDWQGIQHVADILGAFSDLTFMVATCCLLYGLWFMNEKVGAQRDRASFSEWMQKLMLNYLSVCFIQS